MPRIVITGIGLISPIGNVIGEFWQSLVDGRSGIGRITRFDPTSYVCQVGGEVRGHPLGRRLYLDA